MSTGHLSRKKMPSRITMETRSKSRMTRSSRKEVSHSDSDSDSLEAEMRALGVHMQQCADRAVRPPGRDHPTAGPSQAGADPSVEATCNWCFKLGPKSFSQTSPSNDETSVFCSEQCFSQWRRATFKKAKICDWCKHVRHSVNYSDQLEGDQILQFCSDKCLNQYKMSVFCKETQAHILLLQNANGTDLKFRNLASLAGGSNKTAGAETGLITPDLWMRNCKDSTPDDRDDESDEQIVKVKQEVEEASEGEAREEEAGEDPPLPKRQAFRDNEPTCKMTKMLLKRAELPMKSRPDLNKQWNKVHRQRKEAKPERAPVPPLYPIIPGMPPNISALFQQTMHTQPGLTWMPPYLMPPNVRQFEDAYRANGSLPDLPARASSAETHQQLIDESRNLEEMRSPILPESLPSGLTIERVDKKKRDETSTTEQVIAQTPQASPTPLPQPPTVAPAPLAGGITDSFAAFFKALLPGSVTLVPFPVIIPIPIPIPIPFPIRSEPRANAGKPASEHRPDEETLDLSMKR